MDWSVTHAFNRFLAANDGLEDPLSAYSSVAQLLFAALVVGLLLVRPARRAAVAAGASLALSLLAAQVLSRIADRPRPFVTHAGDVHSFVAHAADPGFPSDHATAAFAIAVALLLRHRAAGLVALVAAAVLAVARVGLAVHYPTDVLVGAALGSAVALALWPPRPRARIDALADRAGALADGVLARVGLGPSTT